jgi:putative chitinase
MIDRKGFYDAIRPQFDGHLTDAQVQGIEAILDEWERRELTDKRWLAYMLATVFHETAKTMQPVREYNRGKGHPYGMPSPSTGETYYGRGFVQLTWDWNYKKMGALIGVDLYHLPDLALQMDIAVKILFEGMIHGSFTGKSLANYLNDKKTDWVGARKIINGIDRAEHIAVYALKFNGALHASFA